MKRTVEDIIEIGRELTAAKDRLEHGQFLPWIAAEFEMAERTANNLMAVSNRFGSKFAKFADFNPSILYALAAPSTPDSVIERAIEKAETGEKVAVADVKTWKAEYEEEKQRSEEWKEQWKETRDKDRSLELELAGHFMNVADRFGEKILNNLEFTPTIIYLLAAPSTPEPVIEQAIERFPLPTGRLAGC